MIELAHEASTDTLLASLIEEVSADADSLGLIVHGSRAAGVARTDSDYDLIWVVTDEAYAPRRARGTLVERRALRGQPVTDILFQSPGRLRWLAENPGWWTATYVASRVLLDKTGEVEQLRQEIAARAGERARQLVAEEYDSYLNGFVRSLKSWRRRDEIGARAHAAESVLHLMRALFGLEGRWAPYHDMISAELPEIEEAQGWRRGYLQLGVLRLLESGDPTFQQELELHVEQLMLSRGIRHEWGDDLQPIKALRFVRYFGEG